MTLLRYHPVAKRVAMVSKTVSNTSPHTRERRALRVRKPVEIAPQSASPQAIRKNAGQPAARMGEAHNPMQSDAATTAMIHAMRRRERIG